jgi:hypothetical protein
MLVWPAVGVWGAAALGGLTMAAIFWRHNGMAQSERTAIGPLRVFPHVGLAVIGFAFWVAYAVTDNDVTAWVATAAIGAAFLIAGTFLLTRDQHRRADLARIADPEAVRVPAGLQPGSVDGGLPGVAAERFIPIWLASAHGLLGAAALILVLLDRSGVGGS